nr:MAG TPA: hypothetical protein [Bacteriophage sp.]
MLFLSSSRALYIFLKVSLPSVNCPTTVFFPTKIHPYVRS